MGDFWAQSTRSEGLFSELYDCQTNYNRWPPSGTVEKWWAIISPMKSTLWCICFIRTKPISKDLKGNPVCYAVVLEGFTPILLPECSVEPWGGAHSQELSPCYWGQPWVTATSVLVSALAVAAVLVPWFVSQSGLRLSNKLRPWAVVYT